LVGWCLSRPSLRDLKNEAAYCHENQLLSDCCSPAVSRTPVEQMWMELSFQMCLGWEGILRSCLNAEALFGYKWD